MKFNFLLAAISDAQEIIRFIDTKSAFATIILGGIVAFFFSDYETIYHDYCFYSWYTKFFLWMMLFGIVICIYCMIKVIMPINKIYCEEIIPRFYLGASKNKCSKLFPENIEIIPAIHEYQKQIGEASEEIIIKSLTCELYTVSYIRDVKTKRLNNLLVVLVITAIFFIISFVLVKMK